MLRTLPALPNACNIAGQIACTSRITTDCSVPGKKHGTLAQKRGMSERRARGSRLSKRTAAEEDVALPMEPEPEPLHVRRSTRRTSVTTVSRSHANGGMPQASVLAQSFHVDGSHPAEVSGVGAKGHDCY